MQYLFEDGNEVPVILPPHGNEKRSSISRRTQSKMSKAKPKNVVSEVCKEMGGSIVAGIASELPRSRWQVYNAQQSSTSSATDSTASGSTRSDPIFELIKQCKEDMLPNGRRFVRSVGIDPAPSCILASESQLKHLKRFSLIQLNHVFLVWIQRLILANSMSQLLLIVIFTLRIKIQASHLFSLDQYRFTQRRHEAFFSFFLHFAEA